MGKTASQLKFDDDRNNDRKYIFKAICDNGVYARKSDNHLPGLYYLVFWKNYPEEENT